MVIGMNAKRVESEPQFVIQQLARIDKDRRIGALGNQRPGYPTSSKARIASLRTVSRSIRSYRTSYPRPGVS